MFTNPQRTLPLIGVESGMRVADFGSGSGAYVVECAHAVGLDGHVYAVDIQKNLLDTVVAEAERSGYRNITPIWTDMEKEGFTKLNENTLDLVIISNTLFQLKNKTPMFFEAARVLVSGGRLAVIDWEDSFGSMGPQVNMLVGKQDVLDMASQAGLSLEEEFNPGEHHYGLVFSKQ